MLTVNGMNGKLKDALKHAEVVHEPNLERKRQKKELVAPVKVTPQWKKNATLRIVQSIVNGLSGSKGIVQNRVELELEQIHERSR